MDCWIFILFHTYCNLDIRFSIMLYIKYENLSQIGEHEFDNLCPFNTIAKRKLRNPKIKMENQ